VYYSWWNYSEIHQFVINSFVIQSQNYPFVFSLTCWSTHLVFSFEFDHLIQTRTMIIIICMYFYVSICFCMRIYACICLYVCVCGNRSRCICNLDCAYFLMIIDLIVIVIPIEIVHLIVNKYVNWNVILKNNINMNANSNSSSNPNLKFGMNW
jgi:hypothetical protein